MVQQINELIATGVGLVWGLPLVFLLVGSGIFFTIALGFPQIKGFVHALKVVAGKFTDADDPGEISHFQALCTALSATVGLGNIAGVAIAIHVGGPGATFWMIICGLLGMATKYSECSLAVMFRKVDTNGEVHGGPMHYITLGLGDKWKPLAMFFAFAAVISSFGAANMFQTNQVANIMNSSFGIPDWVTGLVMATAGAIVIIGGIKRIASVTEWIVPVMAGTYILGALTVIIMEIEMIPAMFAQIFEGAFTGIAATGGAIGITVKQALITGVQRAAFSNEAGLGSAAIAHSAASTDEPIREGSVALLEPFIDTVVICTMTALVVNISGAWTQDLSGVELTAAAFDHSIPGFGSYFIPIAVFLFAFSTLISWSYYGERAIDFMFGHKGLLPYRTLFCILAFVGAVWKSDAVLNFSDMMLGLMVIPNLIAVYLLFPKLRAASNDYFARLKSGEIKEN